MNNPQELDKANYVKRNDFLHRDYRFIALFVSFIYFLLKRIDRVFLSDEWNPVQMGWFTSCYCSCRSCIG
jgi:hypothetical protein